MPAKTKSSTLADFQNLLREMFHIDATELNFGIYRVIRQRSAMIEKKLIAAMPEICADVLSQITDDKNEAAQNDVLAVAEKVQKTIGTDAIDKDGNLSAGYAETYVGKEYEAAKVRARTASTTPKETDIFNHLLQFFGYYYSNGDFMPSHRIANRGVYSLPYNGEDVMLHWANRGQYYVKTTERFLSYAFVTGTTKVRFIVEKALNLPENNNKSARKFFFPQPDQATMRDGEFTIPFQYRVATPEDELGTKNGKGQDEINSRAEEYAHKLWDKKLSATAKKDLLHAEKDAKSSWLQALESYARGNNSDFFIHKDLDTFLNNELKAYLTNHILDLDEITQTDTARGEAQLLLARAVRDVARRVIQFLTQLENFQKVLWEKRKFITQTNYIIRWGAVLEHRDNAKADTLTATIVNCKEQWEEWQELGFLKEPTTDIFAKGKESITARTAFLREHLSVPLDTRYFDDAFTMDVLACFDDIDEATDGVLMHSENWQALNLLSGKYAGKVKCVYIDPPYNTDASAILYKNDYKHSSWLSLMHDRIALSQSVLTNGGILCCAIDDVEVGPLRAVMEMIFPKELGIAPVYSNPPGRKSSGQFSPTHEYAIFYGNEESVPGILKKTEKQLKNYPHKDQQGHFTWIGFVRSGTNDRREDRPKLFYPIFVNDKNELRIPKIEWDENSRAWVLQESAKKNETVIYPTRKSSGQSYEGNWQRGHTRVATELEEYRARPSADGEIKISFKARMDENALPNTWWDRGGYASTNGTIGLGHIIGGREFDFPKSVRLVEDCLRASGIGSTNGAIALDFFAGSGTTAHAIINLNREDGGRRKFILVEMGEYFDTVLTPRIKKIIFTPDWKDGKPAHQNGGDLFPKESITRAPRIIKYHRMESYEDALDNIQFDADDSLFDDDYEYRYMLRWESRQCTTFAPGGQIDNPFSYTLKRAGKEYLARADLPETFNTMAGLHLQQRRIVMNGTIKYQIDLGILDGKKTALIWRDIAGWQDADKSKDHLFIAELGEQKWLSDAQTYVNGDSDIGQTKSLSPKFHDLMFAKVE